MPIPKTITPGDRFGRWTALTETETRTYPSGTEVRFRSCRCDCGTVQWVGEYKLRTGHSRSCGCLQSEVTTQRSLKHGRSTRGNRSPVYGVWRNMISRCTNPNVESYKNYGARGITVCERWLKFENFFEDMGEPPDGLTIDRVDNNGNYFRGNCRWATRVDQARNRGGKRKTVTLTFNGFTLSLVGWSEKLGIAREVLSRRYYAGWSTEKILTTPIGGKRTL